MEYVFVHFDVTDIRDVLADDIVLGKTEKKLMLDAGDYQISLSGSGYMPTVQDLSVSGTSPSAPLKITFTKSISGQPTTAAPPQQPGNPTAGV
jgi:hypothetical protein